MILSPPRLLRILRKRPPTRGEREPVAAREGPVQPSSTLLTRCNYRVSLIPSSTP